MTVRELTANLLAMPDQDAQVLLFQPEDHALLPVGTLEVTGVQQLLDVPEYSFLRLWSDADVASLYGNGGRRPFGPRSPVVILHPIEES